MKKKLIRNGVFETNSSSAHSVSIASGEKEFLMDPIYPNGDGQIILNGGEYGWEWFKTNDALEKANYAAQTLGESINLINILMEQTGATEVIIDVDGYVDHQSHGILPREEEQLKNFIFNKNSWLFGGNDNSSAAPNFYIVPEYRDGKLFQPQYTHQLKIDDFDIRIPFIGAPTVEQIKEALEGYFDDKDITEYEVTTKDTSIMGQINRVNTNYFDFMSYEDYSLDMGKGDIIFTRCDLFKIASDSLKGDGKEYDYATIQKMAQELATKDEHRIKTEIYVEEL